MMSGMLSHLVLMVVSNLVFGYAFGFALIALSIVAERIVYPHRATKRNATTPR
jgi:hypothetical protein